MAKNPETVFQDRVLKYLKKKGGYWIKIHVSSFQSKGEPDVVGVYKGRFVAFEIKRPDGKGKYSELQEYKLQKIRDAGGVAMFLDSMERLEDLFKDDKILRL